MLFDAFLTSLGNSVAGISAIPLAVHLPVVLVLIAGVVLCLAGSRLLRPVYICCLSSIGSMLVALMAPNFLNDSVGGVPSPLIGMVVGAILGGVLAVASFRFALGLTCSVTFVAAGFLCALTYLWTVPGAIPPSDEPRDRLASSWEEKVSATQDGFAIEQAKRLMASAKARLTGGATPEASESSQESARVAAANTRAFLDEVLGELRDLWRQMPVDSRVILLSASMGAAMLGFVLGVLSPLRAGAATTSVTGSLLVVLSAAWLLSLAGIVRPSLLERGPLPWLAVWIGLTLTGFMIQTPGKAEEKDKGEAAEA